MDMGVKGAAVSSAFSYAASGILMFIFEKPDMASIIKAGIPIFEYTPLQIKQSLVGYGRAEKKQVQEMMRLMLKLDKVPKPDDTADALAMAICHGHVGGSGLSSAPSKRKLTERQGI